MSTVVAGRAPAAAVTTRSQVLRALVHAEARRMMRNPVPWLCLALSVWGMWRVVPEPGEWPAASYEAMNPTAVPLLFGISLAVAVPFHRARQEVAPAAPVAEDQRMLARLLAATPFVLVTAAFAGLVAWRERDLGGLWIGMEPGRTTEALHTTAELSQFVVLGVLDHGIRNHVLGFHDLERGREEVIAELRQRQNFHHRREGVDVVGSGGDRDPIRAVPDLVLHARVRRDRERRLAGVARCRDERRAPLGGVGARVGDVAARAREAGGHRGNLRQWPG